MANVTRQMVEPSNKVGPRTKAAQAELLLRELEQINKHMITIRQSFGELGGPISIIQLKKRKEPIMALMELYIEHLRALGRKWKNKSQRISENIVNADCVRWMLLQKEVEQMNPTNIETVKAKVLAEVEGWFVEFRTIKAALSEDIINWKRAA
jgi:hypothetical protein